MIGCRSVGLYSVVFIKQKTAYEMRISDWSSDVCSSDLEAGGGGVRAAATEDRAAAIAVAGDEALGQQQCCRLRVEALAPVARRLRPAREIGRASSRESVWQYVSITVGAVS